MKTYSPEMAIKLGQELAVKFQLDQLPKEEGLLKFIEEVTPSLYGGAFEPRAFLSTVRGRIKLLAEVQQGDNYGERAREFFEALGTALDVKIADL